MKDTDILDGDQNRNIEIEIIQPRMFGLPSVRILSATEERYRQKVRKSCVDGISRARKRETENDNPAPVDLTNDEIARLLEDQEYLCLLTRQRFWLDDSDKYGPTMPSIDRIDPDGPYRLGNVRLNQTSGRAVP